MFFVFLFSGIFCGGYHYSLKMYIYERVRGRNFSKAWGFIQWSQAIPIIIGVSLAGTIKSLICVTLRISTKLNNRNCFAGFLNNTYGDRMGYYFSSSCVFLGSLILFVVDLHKRSIARHKHTSNGKQRLCTKDSCPQRRRLSFIPEPEHERLITNAAASLVLNPELVPPQGNAI